MKKLLALALLAAAAAAAFTYLRLGRLAKAAVETLGPQLTQTEVRLRSVTLSPLSGRGQLSGLFIGNPEGFKSESAFKLGSVRVEVDLKSLATERILVKEIIVDGPEITYEGSLSGSNLARIQRNVESFLPASPKTKDEKPGKAKKVEVRRFKVVNGKVHLGLSALGGKGVSVPLPDIELVDIGRESGGVSPGEAAKRMLGAITGAALKAAAGAGSLLKGGTEALQDAGQSALGAVKGIFGRK